MIMKLFRGIPAFLVGVRFLLGPFLYWSVYAKISPWWFICGFIFAFLSDIFDGIIARRLHISTPALRTADSWVDTWFYFWIMFSVWVSHSESVTKFAIPLGILMVLQVSEWIYGRIKFGRLTGYHAYSAKAWGIALFAGILSIMLFEYDGVIWWTAILLGWICSIESWLLTITVATWTTDVKSVFHVWQAQKIQKTPT